MTVSGYSGTFTINVALKGPSCTYCDNEGLPFWDEGGTWWLCRHHRELQQSGWLDLVLLVKEAEGE